MWVKNENKQREVCRRQKSRHARQRCTGRVMTQSSYQPGTGWPILTLVIVVEHSFLFFPSSSGRVDHSCYNVLQCVTTEQSSLNDLQQSNAQSSPTLIKLDSGSELEHSLGLHSNPEIKTEFLKSLWTPCDESGGETSVKCGFQNEWNLFPLNFSNGKCDGLSADGELPPDVSFSLRNLI